MAAGAYRSSARFEVCVAALARLYEERARLHSHRKRAPLHFDSLEAKREAEVPRVAHRSARVMLQEYPEAVAPGVDHVVAHVECAAAVYKNFG